MRLVGYGRCSTAEQPPNPGVTFEFLQLVHVTVNANGELLGLSRQSCSGGADGDQLADFVDPVLGIAEPIRPVVALGVILRGPASGQGDHGLSGPHPGRPGTAAACAASDFVERNETVRVPTIRYV